LAQILEAILSESFDDDDEDDDDACPNTETIQDSNPNPTFEPPVQPPSRAQFCAGVAAYVRGRCLSNGGGFTACIAAGAVAGAMCIALPVP
jgi:hypothetical protein